MRNKETETKKNVYINALQREREREREKNRDKEAVERNKVSC